MPNQRCRARVHTRPRTNTHNFRSEEPDLARYRGRLVHPRRPFHRSCHLSRCTIQVLEFAPNNLRTCCCPLCTLQRQHIRRVGSRSSSPSRRRRVSACRGTKTARLARNTCRPDPMAEASIQHHQHLQRRRHLQRRLHHPRLHQQSADLERLLADSFSRQHR